MARPDEVLVDECETKTRSIIVSCTTSGSECKEAKDGGKFNISSLFEQVFDACDLEVVNSGPRSVLQKRRANSINDGCPHLKRCCRNEENRPVMVQQVMAKAFVQCADCEDEKGLEVANSVSRPVLQKKRASANKNDCPHLKRCRRSEENRPMTVQQVMAKVFVQCADYKNEKSLEVANSGSRSVLQKTRASANNGDCPDLKRCRLSEENQPMVVQQVVEKAFVQCADCKTKDSPMNSRHKDLGTNISADTSNKYCKGVQIVVYLYDNIGPMQLQTRCRCGQIRIFTQRRAVRKGIAITYFATEKCTCGQHQTDKLLVCFCGALFRTIHSLYACPCFGRLGPAFAEFPNYARFAPRPCPCTTTQRQCDCIRSAYTRFQTV